MSNVTDRTPYTYVITHLPSGKKYCGSRYAKNCNPDDLWNTYFTSSQTIKEIINHDGKDSFSTSIQKHLLLLANVEPGKVISFIKWMHGITMRGSISITVALVSITINPHRI